mgnify:FL=1
MYTGGRCAQEFFSVIPIETPSGSERVITVQSTLRMGNHLSINTSERLIGLIKIVSKTRGDHAGDSKFLVLTN